MLIIALSIVILPLAKDCASEDPKGCGASEGPPAEAEASVGITEDGA